LCYYVFGISWFCAVWFGWVFVVMFGVWLCVCCCWCWCVVVCGFLVACVLVCMYVGLCGWLFFVVGFVGFGVG
jgi:hypothetical protein